MLWSVWGGLVVLMAALHVYRSTLTRDEEDQLFLDDSFEQEKNAQAVIATKVGRVEPIVQISHWLVGAATVGVIAYYIWQTIFVQLHLI